MIPSNFERLPIKFKIRATLVFVGFFFAMMCCATAVWAYFSIDVTGNSPTTLNINTLFGILDQYPVGASWGTENNPFLIHSQQHLNNLYKLQNNGNRSLINENTYFQVSNPDGSPCYVGGSNYNNLMEIYSIGSEDFPFISNLKGVTGATYTLPDGEITDTSSFANIRVVAQEGQIDIGLFGCVGPSETPSNGEPVGSISNLLLTNIQISTTSVGDNTKNNHPSFFTTSTPHETNHIGILAGHAQNTMIFDISVYYTDANPSAGMTGSHSARVPAFDINPTSSAKYTTSGGILGYYKNLFINPNDTEHPVNSDGLDDFGGTNVGFGLGIVYSEDIWRFMERNYFAGEEAPGDEYNFQETFDDKLYGPVADNPNERYFRIGVFTFAHSSQTLNKDRMAKLWKTVDSNLWTVSTSGNYSSEAVDMGDVSYRYNCTQIQYNTDSSLPNHFTSITVSGSTFRGTITTIGTNATFNYQNYRFLIVVETANGQYALTRYGYTAAAQKIDTNNFVIPQSQLNYYTFIPYQSRQQSNAYPPYYNNNAYRYYNPTNIIVNPSSSSATTNYFTYGNELTNSSNVIYEAERPLRIWDSVSFMATSVSGSPEGIHLAFPGTPSNYTGTNTAFRLQRSTGGSNQSSRWLSFTESSGFNYVTSASSSTPVKLYAVRITNNPTNQAESPVSTAYNKIINTPTSNLKTYDMRLNTLHYVGNRTGTTAESRLRYNVRSIESLEWAANDGLPITKADTVIKMADPTSYYYLSNVFWGVEESIPSPSGSGTIDVPQASIGFTVNNTGNNSSVTSRIFAIVATDPSQDVDQTITISYFNTSNARTEETSFPLPPVPGSSTATTTPIYICDASTTSCPTTSSGSLSYYHAAYPNLNTLLVSYEISVTTTRNSTRTFFLEASKGSANFVYLSAERTAAKDSNPDHENDLELQSLAGIDFVVLRNSIIQTVNRNDSSSGGYYVQSLIVPYFGLKTNPANPDGSNPNLDAISLTTHALDPYRFTWSITRCYFTSDNKHVLYIYANNIGNYSSSNLSTANITAIITAMNFNYTEGSYLDQDAYAFIYSDIVYDYLNNTLINWTQISY